ncbi:vacuolar transporter chaperone [Mortierella polycephala]|uniref:Vacuolar transporter chaperone n=1 Tax=Mortierella polycephala TaxID=41804 RepID=A0A9P6U6V3_9FUNG|nr:vacuolar transporter chaperone [Mortierella polycephala]
MSGSYLATPSTSGSQQQHIHTTTMPALSSSQPILQATPGKRIALPVRIEPKVFFANERTFLSWLNFTVLLGSLSIGLLNFGDKIGRISAGVFTFVAIIVMIYALATFHWRADRIRKRQPGPYDDRFGPTLLCVFILAAILINFGLRFNDDGI